MNIQLRLAVRVIAELRPFTVERATGSWHPAAVQHT